jgi:hypothetical protein
VSLASKAIIVFVVASIVGLIVPTYLPVNQVIWWVTFGPVVSFAFVGLFAVDHIRKNQREAEEAAREERSSRARS